MDSCVSDVTAKLTALPIQFVKVDASTSVVEDLENANLATPAGLVNAGAVTVLYQDTDNLANFEIKVPVLALDETDETLPVNRPSVEFETSGWIGAVSGGAVMTEGVALVPVRLTVGDPNLFKLEVGQVRLGVSSASTLNIRPQQVMQVVAVVVRDAPLIAPRVANLFSQIGNLAVVAGGAIANTLFPPQVPQYVNDQRAVAILPFPSLQKPIVCPVFRRPLTVYPVVLPASVAQAPFRDNPPLSIADLAIPTLPCNPNWTPPDPQTLADLMQELTNVRELDKDFGLNRIDSKALQDTAKSNIFKYPPLDSNDPLDIDIRELNQIVGLNEQVDATRQTGLTPIRDFLTFKPLKNAFTGLSKDFPKNLGAFQHAQQLKQTLTNIKLRLTQRGDRGPKNQPKECFSNRDLDFLYALYRLIQDALTNFDRLGPW